MDRAHGRAPEDDPPYTMLGWVADLAPAERARLSAEAIRTMARIHTVDVEACGLQGLDRQQPGETLLDRELAHFVEWLEWGREGEPNEVVDAAFDWVRQNRPAAEGRLALSWGDSRIGNMLFDEDLRCTVVLDWEFATLAAPELDLGWWLFMQAHFTDALGVPLPEGLHSTCLRPRASRRTSSTTPCERPGDGPRAAGPWTPSGCHRTPARPWRGGGGP